jgi:NADPH:quinone reductase-like Zn-dependent oxidoreductase
VKAVVRDRYGSADVLRVEDIPTPVPRPGEVLVNVRAASLNTADLDYLLGRPPIGRLGTGVLTPRTRFLGLDMAGQVEAIGEGVTRFQAGDEVWADLFSNGFGAFAEYVCAPQTAFEHKPDEVPFDIAATVPHSGLLALQALRSKGGVQAGDEVVVNGGGGCVGPFAIQIAKSMGALVTGVDHGGKLDLMRRAGADQLIDYSEVDFTQTGRRYDFILDIAAHGSAFAFRRALKPGGSYVQVARSVAGFFQAAVFGAIFGGGRRMGIFMWIPNRGEDLAHMGRLIQRGEVSPIVDRTYPLDQASEALRFLDSGETRGKVVITP